MNLGDLNTHDALGSMHIYMNKVDLWGPSEKL